MYTASQKTTLMLHTITTTDINHFGNFWQMLLSEYAIKWLSPSPY